jgi:uncharacterized protein YdaU (DUF1376 family)
MSTNNRDQSKVNAHKPWFKFHVADFRTETLTLSAAQRGAYISLLMYYWEHEGLPNDDEKLARIAGMHMRDWRRNRTSIAALFGPCWNHNRINALLLEWMEKVNKTREAAMQMHSKRRANVYAFDMLRARVSESRYKNSVGESESSTQPPEGIGGVGERGTSRGDSMRQEPPEAAFDEAGGKSLHEMSASELVAKSQRHNNAPNK